jgi:hypothetical protein
LTGSPGWVVDTTIATGLPLGTPISAFITVVSASRVVFYFQLDSYSHSESFFPPYSKWRWCTTQTRVGVSLLHSQAWMWAAGALLLRSKFECRMRLFRQVRFTVSDITSRVWNCDISRKSFEIVQHCTNALGGFSFFIWGIVRLSDRMCGERSAFIFVLIEGETKSANKGENPPIHATTKSHS